MPFVTSLVLLIAVAVDSRESVCPCRRRPQPDNESNAGDTGVRKTQLGPGVRDLRERCETVKRLTGEPVADQRVSKLRPNRVTVVPQA